MGRATGESEQGVPDHYTNLLAALYADQTAATRGSRPFPIRRGGKQGDIISPISFNAGLELAFRKWKKRLTTKWQLLDGDGGRLTNARYADDIMLYAKSPPLPELIRGSGSGSGPGRVTRCVGPRADSGKKKRRRKQGITTSFDH